jgi:mono/diheme cytochrome c family protein
MRRGPNGDENVEDSAWFPDFFRPDRRSAASYDFDAAEDASTPSTIRAGSEIALDSCSGCHVVSPRQQFRPVGGEEIPSFEAIANGPDATANALLKNFNDTHRKKDAPQATSIFATTYISDLETSQVIAYLLTQRHQP